MSREEVEAELRKADIDPARTVKAVEELVRAALARWQSDDSTKTS
ncbi:MAG TPA: hypothetical protein VFO89_03240 [Thermoanaerobaculia bacterium]|nr:hypothetical protein [Thermoanaerobaculia bacterium]